MKIAVMGAGSVGCYYGGLLARAGATVTLVGRAVHVDAIQARGLLLETATGRQAVPLRATTEALGVAGADLVLFCVKSGDTETVGRAIAPFLAPDAAVLSFQNGVDNPERLRAVLGRPVVPVAVYVATGMPGPGHVRHHGRGDVVMGPFPRSEAVAALFAAAGIPTEVSERALDALWGKLIVNCAYNALSAITQLPYGRLLAVPGIDAVMSDLVAECVAVAQASGITVSPDILAQVLALAATMPDQVSSTAQDLARGRPSEIAHLNGFILRKGQAAGLATPVNQALTALVRAAEIRGVPGEA
ncbi:2-dehydropantoate 2-reductase [Methylobacterium sp. Leaf104]|uniref:ketopantoate reductase family protein n=1 Tax=Methylobacterium TaxID=407 RepID=UPI0006F1DF61|nr:MULTISPECIES: ketopantoate reductase family protein [Methylobacterium]KQP40649.1 2-dehydropantoate 2-reductase [Methylobacterium sp. Leaf104]MCI9882780.1 ketopantoate reductase family protein [Methylobacterium goesingense]